MDENPEGMVCQKIGLPKGLVKKAWTVQSLNEKWYFDISQTTTKR